MIFFSQEVKRLYIFCGEKNFAIMKVMLPHQGSRWFIITVVFILFQINKDEGHIILEWVEI